MGFCSHMLPSSQSPHHPPTLDYSQVQFHLQFRGIFLNHWSSTDLLLDLMYSSRYVLFGINFVLWFLQRLAWWDSKTFVFKTVVPFCIQRRFRDQTLHIDPALPLSAHCFNGCIPRVQRRDCTLSGVWKEEKSQDDNHPSARQGQHSCPACRTNYAGMQWAEGCLRSTGKALRNVSHEHPTFKFKP